MSGGHVVNSKRLFSVSTSINGSLPFVLGASAVVKCLFNIRDVFAFLFFTAHPLALAELSSCSFKLAEE